MANQLTKESGENEIKAYFTEVMHLSKQSEKEFIVDFDEVWPLVYKDRRTAINELKQKFLQDIDYQTVRKKVQSSNVAGFTYKNDTFLTVPCLEFFIARKVRPVFEVYRQVFHKTAQAISGAAKKNELTRESLVDEWGDPVIDLRLYYEFLASYKPRKYTDWLHTRFQYLSFTEGKDYAVTDESRVDTVRRHAAREYALSLRSFAQLVRLDSLRNKKPDTRRRLYDLLHLLRECDERERAGRIDMHEYVNTVRQRIYGTTRIRIAHRRVERPATEQTGGEKPFSIYDPLPMPEDTAPARGQEPLVPSLVSVTQGETSLVGTMRRLSVFDHEITHRFNMQMQLTGNDEGVKEVMDRYEKSYGDLRNAVGNLAFIEAANQADGEINGYESLKANNDNGKEATR